MIVARGLWKSYGSVCAVRDVSFEISPGQVVGLLGPNGAGKTTTIRMLVGYLPPSAGSISICGFDSVDDSMQTRRCIGYLPESAPLYPEMRVRDYLVFRSRLYGVPITRRGANISKAVGQLSLKDVQNRRIGALSKGYRQRVGIAAALVHDPQVLVLDEPSSGLDPAQIRESRALIRGLAQDKTVLISSHILPEVERTCDRVLIIARGRLRADGAPAHLIARMQRVAPPAHTVELLAVAPPEGVSSRGASELDRVLAALRSLRGVAGVSREVRELPPLFEQPRAPAAAGTAAGLSAPADSSLASWVRLSITPSAESPDLREPIARTLGALGVVYRELHRATPTLEQLFIRVIETEDAAARKGGAGASGGGP